MGEQLADLTLVANNDIVAVTPNSIVWDDGLGEQSVRNASTGGGGVEQIFSDNVEERFSTLKFSLPSTIPNIEMLRVWKNRGNSNVFQLLGQTSDGKLKRTFQAASLVGKYDLSAATDADIELEIRSNPAV